MIGYSEEEKTMFKNIANRCGSIIPETLNFYVEDFNGIVNLVNKDYVKLSSFERDRILEIACNSGCDLDGDIFTVNLRRDVL